jgi:hypothetical protein
MQFNPREAKNLASSSVKKYSRNCSRPMMNRGSAKTHTDGHMARTDLVEKVLVLLLAESPFQLGTNLDCRGP